MLIILSLLKIKSLSVLFRAKVKPIISHYYSHTNRFTESTTWSRSGVFSDSPMFSPFCKSGSMSNNIDLFCSDMLQFYIETCKHVFPLNTDCRVDLPNFILIPSYSIIADKGLEYIYKQQNWATVNPID